MEAFTPQKNQTKAIEKPSTQSAYEDLFKRFEDSRFGNVKIMVDNKNLFAHRVILQARSVVFNEMLASPATKTMNITSFSFGTVHDLLKGMYGGLKYDDSYEDVDVLELFKAAYFYRAHSLQENCEEHLGKSVNNLNFNSLLMVTEEYFAPTLKKYLLRYFNGMKSSHRECNCMELCRKSSRNST